MKRVFKIVGLSVAAILVALVAVVVVSFSGTAKIQDGQRVGGVEVIKDGFVAAFLVDLGERDVALVDAGTDRQGKAILAALARRGLRPEAVKAILLTHGDQDHIAAAPLFPGATVMALGAEVDRVEGRVATGPFKWFRSPRPTGVRVGRIIGDGDVIDLSGVRVAVFAVPGHTVGSAAYLARGTLFMGDAAEITSDGRLTTPKRLFTADFRQARASLVALALRLRPKAEEVHTLACAHSGLLQRGLAPLVELGARP
jgi:hydroxyacylglutathione hydrolase